MTDLNLSDYPEVSAPRRILLGPGPSMVPPSVLQAMTTPILGHLDPAFVGIMDKTQALLRHVFQTANQLTIPISGTGSAGMEAAVVNIIEPGTTVLVCVNGYFGLRLAEMARRCGGGVATIEKPWGEVFTPAEVAAALNARPAKVVAIVHGETSTGAEQPQLDEIARVVHDHGGILLVDTVASLGGAPVKVDEWGIDVCYTGSQKCLSAPPGTAPITFGPRAVEVIEARRTPVASWYLDLTLLRKYWGAERVYHHTAPISSIYALYEALRLVAEEGLEARWARHRRTAGLLWKGMADLDMLPFVPEGHRLVSLTTVRLPDGLDEMGIRRRLLQEYNIEIAGGLGDLKGKVWRVGLMGYSAREENVQALLAALETLLA